MDEERKLGLLKYLGEGSVEVDKVKPWYLKGDKRDTTVTVKYRAPGEHRRSEIPLFMRQRGNLSADNVITSVSARTIPLIDLDAEPMFPSSLEPATRKRQHSPDEKDKKSKKSKKEKHKKKKKKHHHRRSDSPELIGVRQISDTKLEQLRHERMIREAAERVKADQMMRRAQGIKEPTPPPEPRRKYNAQFNPELARQNRDDGDTGYRR